MQIFPTIFNQMSMETNLQLQKSTIQIGFHWLRLQIILQKKKNLEIVKIEGFVGKYWQMNTCLPVDALAMTSCLIFCDPR